MIDSLCALIRETGVSDSGAAARMTVHPSTMSRWKRQSPDFALLLRSAREDFRQAQLSIILETARVGRGTSWRAAAWLLERVFPQDYAPRAAERARFQEQFEAVCASEEEGGVVSLEEEALDRGEPLQNVQNSESALADRTDAGGALAALLPGKPLQNVQKPPLAGMVCPPALKMKGAHGPFPPVA